MAESRILIPEDSDTSYAKKSTDFSRILMGPLEYQQNAQESSSVVKNFGNGRVRVIPNEKSTDSLNSTIYPVFLT